MNTRGQKRIILKIKSVIILFFIAVTSVLYGTNITIADPYGLTSQGNILYVGGNGPGNYTHIQDAINQGLPADTIFVYNGLYQENLELFVSLTLVGEDKNLTIIEGDHLSDVVYVWADDVTITGFTIRYSGYDMNEAGIGIDHSRFSRITNNILDSNGDCGIHLYETSSTVISHNIIKNTSNIGITISESHNITISENTVTQNYEGIQLSYSDNVTVFRNNITRNTYFGIVLYASHNFISENIIDSNYKMIGDEIYGEGIRIYFEGNNIITHNTITSHGYGIITYDSPNNTISSNTIINQENQGPGVYIQQSDATRLINNTLSVNEEYGILLEGSSSSVISYNQIYSCYGHPAILLTMSNNNNVSWNKAFENGCGLSLSSSDNNSIFSNDYYSNGYGIYFTSSSYNRLNKNNIYLNQDEGIYLLSCSHNLIINNNVSRNHYDGIYLDHGNENSIYHNNFLNNTRNAHDTGANMWDNGYPSGGNYWADYTGVDAFSGVGQNEPGFDGIGDTPYNISGKTPCNQDKYPLTHTYIDDEEPPLIKIIKPEDGFLYRRDQKIRQSFFNMIFGKITITANTSDDLSGIEKVEFYIDGKLKETDTTSPYSWIWNEKRLFMHKHIIKVISYDEQGNSAFDEIVVWK